MDFKQDAQYSTFEQIYFVTSSEIYCFLTIVVKQEPPQHSHHSTITRHHITATPSI
jgi:hypothetical protein